MKKFLFGFFACLVLFVAIAATRQPFYAATPTQILSGTCVSTTDGTVTNTFSTAFSSAPKVILSQIGNTVTGTNTITSVTTTGFIVNNKVATCTNNWIAIGVP